MTATLRRFVLAVAVPVLVAGAAGRSVADIVTQTQNFSLNAEALNLSFQEFDHSLGTLTGATITFTVQIDSGTYSVENFSPSTWTTPFTFDSLLILTMAGATGPIDQYFQEDPIFGVNPTLAPFDGTFNSEGGPVLDFSGPDSATYTYSTPFEVSHSYDLLAEDGYDNGATVEPRMGVISLEYANDYLDFQSTVVGTGTATLEYDYIPSVPEPSTVAMIATGFPVGLGIWWRRRRSAA